MELFTQTELTQPTQSFQSLQDEVVTLRQRLAKVLEERDALRQAAIDAHTDELTGLYNRRWLRQFWNGLSAPGRQLAAVVQIDIDRFKTINDRYGHKIGDHAIVHVACALRRYCTNVVRTGGDEFVLLIPRDQSPEDIASSILGEVRHPMPVPSGHLTASVSIGVCPIEVDGPVDLSDAIERADWAMYRAKRQRGDQVVVA